MRTSDLNLRITIETRELIVAAQAAMMAKLKRKVTMTEVIEEGVRLVAKREKVTVHP